MATCCLYQRVGTDELRILCRSAGDCTPIVGFALIGSWPVDDCKDCRYDIPGAVDQGDRRLCADLLEVGGNLTVAQARLGAVLARIKVPGLTTQGCT